MKKSTLSLFIFSGTLMLMAAGCKKQDADFTSEYNMQTDDQLLISAEIDAVTIDANTAVDATDYFFQRNNNAGICDGTFKVDSTATEKLITITYNGTNCSGKAKRCGTVVITMQKNRKWSDMGAILNIRYQDLKITRLADNKSIVLNGALDFTNELGGRLSEVGTRSIIHTIASSGMNILFDDQTTRSWQLAVKRVYSYDNGLVITSTGNHSEGGKTGISAWGLTRMGRHFTTMIAEPMIIRQDCDFRMVSAKLVQEQSETLTIRFGLDAKGAAVTCPSGNYYLQVSWMTARNKERALMVAY